MEVKGSEDVQIILRKLHPMKPYYPSSSSSSSSSTSPVEKISFLFLYQKIIVDRYQDKDSSESVREQREQQILKCVDVTVQQFLDNTEATYKTIETSISGLDLSNYWRETLINNLLCSMQDMLKSGGDPVHGEYSGVLAEVTIRQDRTIPFPQKKDLMTWDIGGRALEFVSKLFR